MGALVEPKVFLVGTTALDWDGLEAYLEETGNGEFLAYIARARACGLSEAEVLTSFYAKLCYASLTPGHNDNLSGVREIAQNLVSTIEQAHMSVFEHAVLNFVATRVSRVFTHELVRHRAGFAFAQTSGRAVRTESIDLVWDPRIDRVRERATALLEHIEREYAAMVAEMDLANVPTVSERKLVTSALRRLLPNGQSNEIGFSVNLRALRHVVMMRTHRSAEWEIRKVFGDVYRLVKGRYPLLFCDAQEAHVDGALEVSGMRMQPYS